MENSQPAYKIRDIIKFAHDVLGMPLNDGQIFWMTNATKLINILKPANQWGKTTAEAILHIYHGNTKPKLDKFKPDYDTWLQTRYQTLNFGKTYEVAKGVMEAIIDITEGNYLLPDGTFNRSLLKGWAIKDIQDAPKLPKIIWWNNAETLIRSYDGLGESFKRLKLAFISGDECGDIPELSLFLNGTLIPRTFFYQGSIHLVGTSQPKGIEYESLAELAEEDVKEKGDKSNYFILSANVNPEMASVYQNKFMSREYLKLIEGTVDENLRRQIIYGFYVDWSSHLYSWEEVNQMFRAEIPYNQETGWIEAPEEDAYYAFAIDLAAAEDETSITVLRYNNFRTLKDGVKFPLPHKIVFHKAWKGKSLPLLLQYQLAREIYGQFKLISPGRCKFIYDAGSLGGKNAYEAFKDLGAIPFPPTGRSYAEIKAEAMGVVKEVLGKNRSFEIDSSGKQIDKFPDWGGVRAPLALKELKRQLEIASRDDEKIKNDQFSSFMMALHFVERRSVKLGRARVVDFNMNASIY